MRGKLWSMPRYVFSGSSMFMLVEIIFTNKSVKWINILALVEFKLQGMEDTDGISWSLIDTNCKSISNLQPTANRVYKKLCMLSIGHNYTLQCESTNNRWWKSNYVIVENSVYCEYAKGTEMINITITGKVYFQTKWLISYINEVSKNHPLHIL